MKGLLLCLALSLTLAATTFAQAPAEKTGAELVMDLRSLDPRIRFNALTTLAESQVQREKAVPAVAKLLRDPLVSVRLQAVKTLGAYGKDVVPVAASLVQSLADPDRSVSTAAAEILMGLGDDMGPALRDGLKDGTAPVRLAVLQLAEAMAVPPAELVPALGPIALKEPQLPLRRAAFLVLAKMSADNPEVLKIVAQSVRDKDGPLRVAAVGTLLNAGSEHWEHLAKAIDDPSAEVRLTIVQALSTKVEELEELHVKAMRKGLEDSDVRIRQIAVAAVARLQTAARVKGGGKEMFSAVAKLLSDRDLAVRRSAIWALGQIGLDDAEELAILAKGLKDPDAQMRGMTVQSVAQYLHEDTPEKLRKEIETFMADGLRDKDRRVQAVAAEILSKEGPASMPVLVQVMEKGGGSSRLWAAYLLGELGGDARPAMPLLEKMARESTPEGRLVARAAIQKIQ